MQQIKKSFKNCNVSGAPFSPCVTDGTWFVSRWDVIHTNTGKRAFYIFGTDGIKATLYNQSNPRLQLTDLVYDTLIKELEKNPDELKPGLFRFEFDGDKFNFCEEEPRWANYDCGVIED